MNVAAWEQVLTKAARNGYISTHSHDATGQRRKANHLSIKVDENLVRDLENPEWGRPVALGAVLVCLTTLILYMSLGHGFEFEFGADLLNFGGIIGRCGLESNDGAGAVV